MSLHDETQVEVEVDQGKLVHILTRYPGQFDVLRELIQNADDAVAPSVQIHFETGEVEQLWLAGKAKDIRRLHVRKWIIKNEGSFREEDWERLGKIAAGNDDSTKVGAFGVGFYSVLSRSDRPLVRSDGKTLQFFRGEDGKLCKQAARCPQDVWTSVELELRVPEPMPALDNLTRFLVSSIILLANIHTISVYLDCTRLVHIRKEYCDSLVNIPIPSHLNRKTPQQALAVDSVQRTAQKITVDCAEWAFTSHSASSSPPNDPGDALLAGGIHDTQDDPFFTPTTPVIRPENELTHDLYTAAISVILDQDSEIRKGVESILELLPSSFKCKGVYFNSEQHRSFARISKLPLSKAHLFKGIVPENNNGRIFIGQSTNQTTGIGLHLSAHFLPTLERGSVDLANGQIADWNSEVLWVSGFLARVIYEEDMRFAESKNDQATKLGLEAMARFSFRPTAPHSRVSEILQDAFFSCASKSKSSFPVVSDIGIRSASDPQFRQTNNELSFLKMYRALHSDVQPPQYSEIIKRYGIPFFRYTDIVNEFATPSGVTHETMMLFFEWWQGTIRNAFSSDANEKTRTAAREFCKKFASRSVLRSSKGVGIPLKPIKYFTPFAIDDDLSHPKSIYIDFSSGVLTRDSIECFGWTQLSLIDWLKHASSEARGLAQNGDPDVGCRLSRVIIQFALGSDLTQAQWDEVSGLVKDIKCIPTNKGLSLPGESYFEAADICQQLPVAKVTDFLDIQGTYVVGRGYRPLIPDHVTKFLTKLGVRAVMEWADLVSMLEKSASKESNDRFLHFLHSKGLTDTQNNDLRTKKVFYSQDHGLQATTRLHLPNDDIQKLGLPILELPQSGTIHPTVYSRDPAISSPMKQFLGSLGIQSYPSLNTVIDCAASDDRQIRETALDYFLNHFEKHYEDYNAEDFAHVAFIPTKCGSRARLHEVFTSSDWEKLKFKQASEKLRPHDVSKLGIKEDPHIDTIIKYFQTPHQTLPNYDIAKLWFEHLSLHGKFSPAEMRDRLSTVSFVPVNNSGSSSSERPTTKYLYYPPKQCFIGSPNSKKYHHDIFPFVDFGQQGNSFLESCCAKKLPDATDIARKMAEDPQKYLKALEDDIKLYMDDLRTIASQFDSIPEDTKKSMRKARMLLGFRQHTDAGELLPPYRVVIGDWESRDFGHHVFLAPEEEIIKEMYHRIGSQFLGAYVQYDIKASGPYDKSSPPVIHDQVIRGVRCFMRQQDQRKNTDIGSMDILRVRVCRTLEMHKTLRPPAGVLADGLDEMDPKVDSISAGIDINTSTLWVVQSSTTGNLHHDIAVALCSALLKTFGPNDVLLLASLIAMDEEVFLRLYGNEKGHAMSSVPAARKVKPEKIFEINLQLPSYLAKVAMRFGARLGGWRSSAQHSVAPEDFVSRAIDMCRSFDSCYEPYDFDAPCQQDCMTFKRRNIHCKEAHKIKLIEQGEAQEGKIRFFLARHARCQEPPEAALDEFSKLILNLAQVFRLSATTACYIFWEDTDYDLMAFNRDQRFIFFNLAHYLKFFFIPCVEEEKVVTEWFLVMAHEIAHNGSLDHDEYHASLTLRLVTTYLPALNEHFQCLAGDASILKQHREPRLS